MGGGKASVMNSSFKMIRDNLVIKDAEVRTSHNGEYPHWLGRKLVEEATEVAQAMLFHPDFIDDKQRRLRIIDEMADVSEVIATIRHNYRCSSEMIEHARQLKFNRLGGFKLGRLLPIDGKSNEQKLSELVQDMLSYMSGRMEGLEFEVFLNRARELDALAGTS